MKIWLVPFKELDNERVLAQHHELHMLWSLLVGKKRKWLNWEKPEHLRALWMQHERIVQEMAIRGMKHETPIPEPLYPEGIVQVDYPVTEKDVYEDRLTLVCRWGGEYKGRGEMPGSYHIPIALYKKYGCLHISSDEKVSGFVLCKRCKKYVKVGDKWEKLQK